jgi:hypothetical protein
MQSSLAHGLDAQKRRVGPQKEDTVPLLQGLLVVLLRDEPLLLASPFLRLLASPVQPQKNQGCSNTYKAVHIN